MASTAGEGESVACDKCAGIMRELKSRDQQEEEDVLFRASVARYTSSCVSNQGENFARALSSSGFWEKGGRDYANERQPLQELIKQVVGDENGGNLDASTPTDVRFLHLLKRVTPERRHIEKVTAYILDHRDASLVQHLVKLVCTLEYNSSVQVVAQLYLVNDLVHNVNVSRREVLSLIESHLKEMFERIGKHVALMSSRIEKQALQTRISNVLNVWETQVVFPRDVLAQIKSALN